MTFNTGDKKSNKLKLTCLLVLLSSLLVACVPTITTVYLKPNIKAKVVDLSTLTPVKNGWATHYPPIIDTLYSKELTNQQGEFTLSAVTNTEFKMLMVGHMLQYYLLKVSNTEQEILVIAQATAEGTTAEEKLLLPNIVIDATPKMHAKSPPKKDIGSTTAASFYDYNYIRALLFEHSLFSSCDTEIGLAALTMLNTARKLYWQQQNKALKEQDLKNIGKNMQASYFYSYNLWSMMKSSCDTYSAQSINNNNRKAVNMIDDIMTEAEKMTDIYAIHYQRQEK
jgi:hypothetical protein